METTNNYTLVDLHRSIARIRTNLIGMKKSGENGFAHFKYYELADIQPILNKLMEEEGLTDVFSIEDGYVTYKVSHGDVSEVLKFPYDTYEVPLNSKGQASMQQIQYFGATLTYMHRYAVINFWNISDGEVIDAMDNGTNVSKEDAAKKAQAKAMADAPISVAEADNLLDLIKNAKGQTPFEERVAKCLAMVGVQDVADLKVSQYNLLVKKLSGASK